MSGMRDCALCHRNVEDELTVAVDFGWGPVSVCSTCMERGEEAETWREDEEEAA